MSDIDKAAIGKAAKIYEVYKKYRKVYSKWLSLEEDSLFIHLKDDYDQEKHIINYYSVDCKKEKLEKKLAKLLGSK